MLVSLSIVLALTILGCFIQNFYSEYSSEIAIGVLLNTIWIVYLAYINSYENYKSLSFSTVIHKVGGAFFQIVFSVVFVVEMGLLVFY